MTRCRVGAARSRLRKEGGCAAEAVHVRSGNASKNRRRADRLQTPVELVRHLDRAVHALVMRDDVAVGVEDVETALG